MLPLLATLPAVQVMMTAAALTNPLPLTIQAYGLRVLTRTANASRPNGFAAP